MFPRTLPLALALAALTHSSFAHAQESQLATLRAAAQDAHNGTRAQIQYGRALRRAGHFDEAVRVLQRAARGATREEALLEIARVRFDQGDFRGSEAACGLLPAGHGPRDPAGLPRAVCSARAHLVLHRAALADQDLRTAVALDPNNGELLLVQGHSFRFASRIDEAERAYRAAAAALPGRAEPYIGLGLLYETNSRMDEAEQAYRQALATDAEDPAANLALGRFLETRRHDHAAALPLLHRANENRPNWAEALVALADVLLSQNQVADALTAYQTTVRLSPTQPGAQSGLGRALLRNNQLPEAETVLRVAIQQVPNDTEAHLALADVLARTQRGEDAIDEYNRAIDLSPQDPMPRMRAAELAHSLGQNTLARAYLDRILADDAQFSPALAMRADILFEENDRTGARQLYQSALAGHGDIDRAHVQARITEIDAPDQHPNRRR